MVQSPSVQINKLFYKIIGIFKYSNILKRLANYLEIIFYVKFEITDIIEDFKIF